MREHRNGKLVPDCVSSRRGNEMSHFERMHILAGPTKGVAILDLALQRRQFFAACLFFTASMTLLAAALADSYWHARAVSEIVGWPGLCLLAGSVVFLVVPELGDRQFKQTARGTALLDHPMADRLLDGQAFTPEACNGS
jgi:hypothetical protein